jgi:GMP synthase PP-ATPase subunit
MDITSILEVIILAMMAVSVPMLVQQARAFAQARLSEQQRHLLSWAVRSAVLAVEQAGLGGDEARKEAISIAVRILQRNGLQADMNYLADLIEAEVYDQFNRFRDEIPRSQRDYTWATVTGTLEEALPQVAGGASR